MLARVGLEMACDAMARQAVKLAGRALALASELRTRLDAGVRSMVSMFCYGGLRKIRNGDWVLIGSLPLVCRALLGSWVCGDGGKEGGAWNSIVVDEGFSHHTIWLWIPGAAGRKLPTPELLPSLMHVGNHVMRI